MKTTIAKQIPIFFTRTNGIPGNGSKIDPPSVILTKWNVLITGKLNPVNSKTNLISDEEIQSVIDESENDHAMLRITLLENLVDTSSIKDKQGFIQFNQRLLIRLLDKLYYFNKDNSLGVGTSLLFYSLSEHLQETLNFIEEFFGNYFDRNEKIPISLLLIRKEELHPSLRKLKIALSKSEVIDKSLNDLIQYHFGQFFSSENISITYRDLSYHKDLLSELLLALKSPTKNMREALYYLNYNEDYFVTHEYERLQQILTNLQCTKQKITALKFEQKNINQLPVKLNCSYTDGMLSLKERMNGWITEEVRFLESGHCHLTIDGKTKENEDKIHTSLSVAKLALLIRLLVIDKIIINRAVAPMLRVAARLFTTLQKDDISFGSLETKYHAPDKATINAVKDMLFKWINIVSKL